MIAELIPLFENRTALFSRELVDILNKNRTVPPTENRTVIDRSVLPEKTLITLDRNRIYIYRYSLSDGSKGIWRTSIKPLDATIELEARFIGRKVINIE